MSGLKKRQEELGACTIVYFNEVSTSYSTATTFLSMGKSEASARAASLIRARISCIYGTLHGGSESTGC